ncbi:hypothetical protein [Enterococcus sp. DIV0175]|uniref:hypothetical protein n=1 Tax=Enterococcus sp. DIV0175 TaxID=2774768 RepID=UPI003D2FEB55
MKNYGETIRTIRLKKYASKSTLPRYFIEIICHSIGTRKTRYLFLFIAQNFGTLSNGD